MCFIFIKIKHYFGGTVYRALYQPKDFLNRYDIINKYLACIFHKFCILTHLAHQDNTFLELENKTSVASFYYFMQKEIISTIRELFN